MQGNTVGAMQQASLAQAGGERDTPLESPLAELGRWLAGTGYHFVTATPSSHARVNARPGSREAHSIEDVFGWNRPFRPSLLPAAILHMLMEAEAVAARDGMLVSRVRFSTLNEQIYVHSAFPTLEPDAVFFGPDTYRFAALIEQILAADPGVAAGRIVDVGCGAGAGGIVAMEASPVGSSLVMTDINPTALRYAQISAGLAGVAASFRCCDLFAGIEDPIDLIVANPPYLIDPQARLYRHGGGARGSALSLRIVREGTARLAAGGRLILYTGSPIVRGRDLLREAVELAMAGTAASFHYRELDPDVFGEDLEMPAYLDVDRIAAVGIVIATRTPSTARGSESLIKNVHELR